VKQLFALLRTVTPENGFLQRGYGVATVTDMNLRASVVHSPAPKTPLGSRLMKKLRPGIVALATIATGILIAGRSPQDSTATPQGRQGGRGGGQPPGRGGGRGPQVRVRKALLAWAD